MKTAKEMFEELGYKEDKHDILINYIKEQIIDDEKTVYGITFNTKFNSFYTYVYGWFKNGEPFNNNLGIDMKHLKAINKQIEELGWDKEV